MSAANAQSQGKSYGQPGGAPGAGSEDRRGASRGPSPLDQERDQNRNRYSGDRWVPGPVNPPPDDGDGSEPPGDGDGTQPPDDNQPPGGGGSDGGSPGVGDGNGPPPDAGGPPAEPGQGGGVRQNRLSGGGAGGSRGNVMAGLGRCDDVSADMTYETRFADTNVSRLNSAQRLVSPAYDPAASALPPYNLAVYQAELLKSPARPKFAAKYLALVSEVPIDAGVVRRINAILCISSDDQAVSEIVEAAEKERLSRISGGGK